MILDKNPNLWIIPMMHNIDVHRTEYLPLVVINLSPDDISLLKGEKGFYANTIFGDFRNHDGYLY